MSSHIFDYIEEINCIYDNQNLKSIKLITDNKFNDIGGVCNGDYLIIELKNFKDLHTKMDKGLTIILLYHFL